jgi:phage gpG-like protein
MPQSWHSENKTVVSRIKIKVTRRENLADQVISVFEKHAADAVMKTAEEAANYAKAIAPERSGDLKRSIDVARVDTLEAAFGAQVDYASFVEFGTSRMAPRSYIMPAAISARDILLKHLTKK